MRERYYIFFACWNIKARKEFRKVLKLKTPPSTHTKKKLCPYSIKDLDFVPSEKLI